MSENKFNANEENQFDALPVLAKDRIHGVGSFTTTVSGYALATWSFMIGGTLAFFVGFTDALIASIAGNMVAVLLMVLATIIPSAKYGTDNYKTSNSLLGFKGTRFFMILLAIYYSGWIVVFSYMIGRGALQIFGGITGNFIDSYAVLTVLGFISLAIIWAVMVKGPKLMMRLNAIIAPAAVVLIFGLIIMIVKDYGMAEVLSAEALMPYDNKLINFLIAFELSLGAGFSWWAQMGGLGRLTKSTKAGFFPSVIGLVFAATLGTVAGTAAALLLGSSDPTTWMIPIGGVVVGIAALFVINFANVTACAITAYNSCIGLTGIKFFSNKKWSVVCALFLIPIAIGMFFAANIYDNFYIILGVAATLFGPMTAMGLVDYFAFRKQRLSLRDMYNQTSTSKYNFWGGVNLVAVFVLLTSVALYFVFLNPFNLVYTSAFQFTTATGAATLYAAIAYFVLGKIFLNKKKGGYDKE